MSRRSLVLALLWCLPACGDDGADRLELLGCERLAYVPAGIVAGRLPGRDCGASIDLLVDRFEVTRELWLAVRERNQELPVLDGRVGQDWSDPGRSTLPAVGMDLREARLFAQARDMRLPTSGEWLYIAAGPRAQFYPWGNSLVASSSNTREIGLGRAAAVGSFASGASGRGVHDLIGNVWEWTAAPVIPGFDPLNWHGPGPSPQLNLVMGGSFQRLARALFDTGVRPKVNALGCEPGDSSSEIGLRCVVDAERYLRAHAAEWSSPATRERVVAVGRFWGPRSARLIEQLAREPGAPIALGWLLEGARR